MYFKRILLIVVIFTLTACNRSTDNGVRGRYSIGVVSYGKSNTSLKQYADFKNYLGSELKSSIEFEPVYNEVRALEQISRKKWDLVFAPPGLAAIAISRYNYEPIMPLEGGDKSRSIVVVKQDSPLEERQDLAGKVIALGQKGSATGYYLPLYNLYGLNFQEILYAPTPQKILQWLDEDKISAGALSLAEYNLYRRDFSPNSFKVIYIDQHPVPPGAILISDRIERNQEAQIIVTLTNTPSFIAASAGFLPNEKLPDYSYSIEVIKRVQEISETPATGVK